VWSEVFILKKPAGKEVAVLLMDTQGAFDSNRFVKLDRLNFSLSLCFSLSHSVSLSLSLCFSISLPLFLSLSLTHTHTLSLILNSLPPTSYLSSLKFACVIGLEMRNFFKPQCEVRLVVTWLVWASLIGQNSQRCNFQRKLLRKDIEDRVCSIYDFRCTLLPLFYNNHHLSI